MEQKYVIAGRSLVTGFEWQGTGVFDRGEAQRYADDLNNDPQNQDHSGAKLCFYWPKAVAPDTLDTSDLDTQPIMAIELCRKCGEPMEELQPADELDDPTWKYFQCAKCGTDRAYWWVDGRKLER